jgi:hypothetical protein
MATSLRELGLELVDPIHPADPVAPSAGSSAPPDPTGVRQALVGHSFKKMQETNDDLRSHNQHGVMALMGFGAFFLSLFLLTQQAEGEAVLLPWRWALVSLGTLAAWGLFFSGFAVVFIVISSVGTRTCGLVRNFLAAFDQYQIECSEGRAKPSRGFPFTGRVTPSAFYGAAYCLVGSGCAGLGLYCWGLVLMKAY